MNTFKSKTHNEGYKRWVGRKPEIHATILNDDTELYQLVLNNVTG